MNWKLLFYPQKWMVIWHKSVYRVAEMGWRFMQILYIIDKRNNKLFTLQKFIYLYLCKDRRNLHKLKCCLISCCNMKNLSYLSKHYISLAYLRKHKSHNYLYFHNSHTQFDWNSFPISERFEIDRKIKPL